MHHQRSFLFRGFLLALGVVLVGATVGCAGSQPTTDDSESPSGPSSGQETEEENGLKPFDEVVPEDATTDEGLITTHRDEDELYFEIPDSLLGREVLAVSRISESQADLVFGGEKVNTQVLRWERHNDDLLLRVVSYEKRADEDDPVFESVRNSSFEPIVKTFSVEALNEDSTGVVINATSLFTSDVPALGLPQSQREEYQVRRLDGERTYLTGVSSFPENTDVEALLTYEAQNPPSSESSGTISVEMNHSMVLLPDDPMTPRYCDKRVGYFSVEHTNYSSDQQRAAEECVITRWRLEPKDPEAFQRGELVEPKEPIVYYVDPATPEQWKPYVKKGIEDWQEAFRAAGFKNAIIGKYPPSAEEDSTFDPADVRFSTVRWFASEIPNAYGPHVHDPRTGEILESDIGMYHNVLNLLRDWYFVQTAAVNEDARGQTFDTEVMGELLRFVVAHEVGHTLGLPHNWGSSDAVPVDSLRSPSYTEDHGTAPSIMDYARFNYVAQPGDGVEHFLPQIGTYDKWSVRWGYQPMPDVEGPEQAADRLDEMVRERADDPYYFYGRQTFDPVDPRSQREDLGRDAMEAGSLGVANLKRIVPNLVDWTERDGDNYDQLEQLYGAAVGQWQLYLGHAVRHVGGVHETFKTYDQDGPVYEPVAAAKQREAMQFLDEHVFQTPAWLVEADVLRRIEASGALDRVREAQADVLEMLLQPARLARLLEAEAVDTGVEAYPLGNMLDTLRGSVWTELASGGPIGPYRRALQRAYLDRLEYLMTEDVESDFPEGFEDFMVETPVHLGQSDIRAHVRNQLQTLEQEVEQGLRRTTDDAAEVHLEDVLIRIERILEEEPGSDA